jgi:hypothetical protein
MFLVLRRPEKQPAKELHSRSAFRLPNLFESWVWCMILETKFIELSGGRRFGTPLYTQLSDM